MEAQTALVGTYGAVELYAVTGVHMHLTIVVNPWHTEDDDAFRLHQPLYDLSFFKLGVFVVDVLNGDKDFFHCL